MKLTIYTLACAVLFAGLLATPTAQQLTAVASAAPVDFEQAAIEYRKQALLARREAAMQATLITVREQLLRQQEADPAVQAELKAIAAMEKAYGDRKVKEAGKDPKTHTFNGKEVVPIAPVPVAEKK